MPTYRMLPPTSVQRQTISFPGNGGSPRVISAVPGQLIDAGLSDAITLEANGWTNAGLVGGTA